MDHKWNRLVAGLCLSALLLSGCAEKPQPTVPSGQTTLAPTQPTRPDPTEPSVTEPPATEPPVTEPPVVLEQAVNKLECTKWRTYPVLQDLGGGLMLATRNQYDSGLKSIICTVEILDMLSDTVVADTILMHTAEPVKQYFADGAVVLAVPSDSTLLVYDSGLNLTDTLNVDNVEGYFSYDRKNYYFAADGMLCRMDVASGNSGAMALQSELRLESLVGIHPTRDLLVARVYLSNYSRNCGLAVIDVRTGAVTMLTDRLDAVQLFGDSFCGMSYDDAIYGYDVYSGSMAGSATVFDASELVGLEITYSLIPGGPYLLRRCYTDDGEHTWIYDLTTGGVCDLEIQGFRGKISGAVYLTGPQLIAGFYEKGLDYYPVLLDPKTMTFETALTKQNGGFDAIVDKTILENLEAELAGPELPAALAQVREQADAIEKAYGIHIRLGSQVEAACAHGDFRVSLCEDTGAISAALDTLEQELAKYPEGFLKQFRNSVLEGGIYVNLTGQIQGGLEPQGFARLHRDRYELALDITGSSLAGTLHHEIWHAIEMRISVEAFTLAGWDACNPSGFAYYGRYNSGYADQTGLTYPVSGNSSYFVDAYSRINGREDRARIFESAMTGNAGVFGAPAIQAKLKFMDGLLRQNFNDSRWTETYWGKYL